MRQSSSSDPETETEPTYKKVLRGIAVVLSVFPLLALLTYNWRAIPTLQIPPQPTANWIGAIGDAFAYHGYLLFGLALWAVPVFCLFDGLLRVFGRRLWRLPRLPWLFVALIAFACLMQTLQGRSPLLEDLMEEVNITDVGGAIGYLLMTKALIPLMGDVGSTVAMLSLCVISLVATLGVSEILGFFTSLFTVSPRREEEESEEQEPEEPPRAGSFFKSILQAREDAKRQREAEREEARRIKEAARAARDEERAKVRAAKEAAKAEREAARNRLSNGYDEVDEEYAPPPPRPIRRAPERVPERVPEREVEKPAEKRKRTYVLPPRSLLNPIPRSAADHSDVDEMSRRLIDTLKLFNVDAKLSYTVKGPVVTKYAVELAPGTKYSTVTNIADNLMGALRAKSLRIEAPIPGESAVGVEVPNRKPASISFTEVFESKTWRETDAELPLLFGKRADGRELVADLASMPHMLVAGATGQGKSVCLNSIICGLLMTRTPEQLKLIMVDPKCVEFTPYHSIPHLLVPVITENRKVVFSLQWALAEMDKRLKLFARARVKNIYDFNRRPALKQGDMFSSEYEVGSDLPRSLPYIVIIIDEAADLIGQCGKEVNPAIQRITQKARAAGIHLILATQRPDAKIITGNIKANIPGRVAFKTSSSVDSRTILDDTGAENLIGRGDMLFRGKDGILVRAQGAWISDEEIAKVTSFIEQHTETQFDDRFTKKLASIKEAEVDIYADGDGDNGEGGDEGDAAATREQVKADAAADLYSKAIECIINTRRASTSHFQRRLGIGYNNAARLCDKLEEAGVIGPQKGAGPREILLDQDALVAMMNGDNSAAASAISASLGEAEDNLYTTDTLSHDTEDPS